MNSKLRPILATVATLAGISAIPAHGAELGRGANVGSLAANCNIGPYPQTSKAGGYNVLCNVMQDSEKCLALVKRQFRFDGQNVTVEKIDEQDVERAKYCFEQLQKDLGL